MIYSLYQKFILKYPLQILSLLLVVILSFSFYTTKLEIDASAETLLLDDDKDLAFSRTMDKRFTTDNILILTYRPYRDLLSDESLKTLKALSHDLESLPHVESVQSLLNLPLLFSPTQEFSALVDNIRTLENSTPDKSLVKQEFLTSPLYKDSLVSKDFKTAAIVIHLHKDRRYYELFRDC
jgi:predicted RND superfamily exporter protein